MEWSERGGAGAGSGFRCALKLGHILLKLRLITSQMSVRACTQEIIPI